MAWQRWPCCLASCLGMVTLWTLFTCYSSFIHGLPFLQPGRERSALWRPEVILHEAMSASTPMTSPWWTFFSFFFVCFFFFFCGFSPATSVVLYRSNNRGHSNVWRRCLRRNPRTNTATFVYEQNGKSAQNFPLNFSGSSHQMHLGENPVVRASLPWSGSRPAHQL